jgi:hypothetical protein
MTDEGGNEIAAGSKISFVVGIPGREVIATVVERRGRLVATNAEASMPLAQLLKFFHVEVVN